MRYVRIYSTVCHWSIPALAGAQWPAIRWGKIYEELRPAKGSIALWSKSYLVGGFNPLKIVKIKTHFLVRSITFLHGRMRADVTCVILITIMTSWNHCVINLLAVRRSMGWGQVVKHIPTNLKQNTLRHPFTFPVRNPIFFMAAAMVAKIAGGKQIGRNWKLVTWWHDVIQSWSILVIDQLGK